ncbi:MAG: hypothetical protein ACREU2_05520 [Steroidobacteraceae bacterium]
MINSVRDQGRDAANQGRAQQGYPFARGRGTRAAARQSAGQRDVGHDGAGHAGRPTWGAKPHGRGERGEQYRLGYQPDGEPDDQSGLH